MAARAYSSDSDSDNESFHSFHDDNDGGPQPPPNSSTTPPSPHRQRRSRPANTTSPSNPTPTQPPPVERFAPDEEASLLAESNSLKGAGNQQFGHGSYENAIQTYDRALASCPNYLDYELAVLRSNVAACHLRLQDWKEAVDSATKGVECLERLEPLPELPRAGRKGEGDEAETANREGDGEVVEVDEQVEQRIENLRQSGHTLDEVRKLQVKLLMRRAKARTEQGGWASLQGADEDYRVLLSPTILPLLTPTDRRAVVESTRRLTPMLNDAKEKEMAEMMGKLKGLGNSILKPFGLSTENFQFVKDENSGGYSMNFNQNPGSKS